MKTSTLTGPDLNCAVAMALGHTQFLKVPNHPDKWVMLVADSDAAQQLPDYAGDIALAWPIMKEQMIGLLPPQLPETVTWDVRKYTVTGRVLVRQCDPNPQVAVLRAFVASVYGDEVELP